MDYFERVEQTLISLLIINIQAVRIECHKHSLQIEWKYSKKWQRNGDLKEIWQGAWCSRVPAGREARRAHNIHGFPAYAVKKYGKGNFVIKNTSKFITVFKTKQLYITTERYIRSIVTSVWHTVTHTM